MYLHFALIRKQSKHYIAVPGIRIAKYFVIQGVRYFYEGMAGGKLSLEEKRDEARSE